MTLSFNPSAFISDKLNPPPDGPTYQDRWRIGPSEQHTNPVSYPGAENSRLNSSPSPASNLGFDNGRHFELGGQFYCSRSEAACAALMQKYIGFTPIDAATIQVPLGKNQFGHERHADFRVHGVFFEYHPTQRPSNPWYWRQLVSFRPGERDDFRRAWNSNAKLEYAEKRRNVIDENPKIRGTELIVATSPEEFYSKVLIRFMKQGCPGSSWRIPSEREVVAEFRRIQRLVIDIDETDNPNRRIARLSARRAA